MNIQFRARIPSFFAMLPRGEKQMQVSAVPIMFAVLLAMLSPNRTVADDDLSSYKQPQCNANPEEQLKPFLAEFGLTELPEPFVPPGITFALAVQTGKLLYLSGTGPSLPGGGFITGKVPTTLPESDAQKAARLTAINLLAVIKKEAGSLKQVKRIVKLFGMVNAEPIYTNHPKIINGASDLLVAVFGECGYHARSAVGMASLPFGIPVEIDMVVELKDKRN